jgi:hypothetical protein
VTTAFWAPNGQYVVLAAMKTGYDNHFWFLFIMNLFFFV